MNQAIRLPEIHNILKNITSQSKDEVWPRIKYSLDYEPKFLFILTLLHSGSTVLAKILNTSSSSMILHKRAEGQWLVPGMCEKDRWNPDKYIDWESVKSVWLSTYQLFNVHVSTLNLVIEKSPPNLLRAESLYNEFSNCAFIAFNRNPYAQCSSSFHRKYQSEYVSKQKRREAFQKFAEKWLIMSKSLKQTIEKLNIVTFTYENFCKDTSSFVSKVIDICPEISDVNIHAQVKAKDYKKQGIVNQNDRQIDLLNSDDILAISSIICKDEEIVKFFGYDVI